MNRARQTTRTSLQLEQLETRQLMAADIASLSAASLSAPMAAVSVTSTAPRIDISAQEQLILEMVNRARANPTAEANRLGIDLNQGLAAASISATAKQPLAPNAALNQAATQHTREMLDKNYFDHAGFNGSTPYDRARSAGYASGAAENIAYRSYWGNTVNEAVAASHDMLFQSPGHRQNLMNDAMRDFGIGVATGQRTSSSGTYPVVMTTENFGRTNSTLRAVTGVAYTDQVMDDDFYSIGEGMANITIIAEHVSTHKTFATTTGTSGGYTLQLEPGSYVLRAFNPATQEVAVLGTVRVADVNIKLDVLAEQFQSTSLVPLPDPNNPNPGNGTGNNIYDCNHDGIVSARDVLAVINQINNPQPSFDTALDINADSIVTPLDALLLINYINARDDQNSAGSNFGEDTNRSTSGSGANTQSPSSDPRLVQLTSEALQRFDGWFNGEIKAEVVSAKTVQWNNSSLELTAGQPQLVTPGYQIVIRAGANLFEYRAASSGSLRYAGMARAADYIDNDPNRVCCPWALDADCIVAIDEALSDLTVDFVNTLR